MYKGAIVGCGAVACQAHVPAWRTASAFRMVAAVDPIPAQRAHIQTLLPEVRCYADLETLFAHEELDFLDVCTPPALHEEGILQACAHGLHVLCEKPLTFTARALQRIMAAAIELHHDENGIVWPLSIAPFQVTVLTLGPEPELKRAAEELVEALAREGVEVLYDDRDERAGVKFKDADLVGIALRIAVGKKGLAELARLNFARARMLREAMKRAGIGLAFSGPTFNEMAFQVGDAEAVVARLAKRGVAAGVPLVQHYPDDPRAKGALLSATTELHSPELIELFAQSVRG